MRSRAGTRPLAVAAALAVLAGAAGLTPVRAATVSPGLKLVAPGSEVTLYRYERGAPVAMDLGVLVAAVDSAFELRVVRPDYLQPPALTQVLHGTGGETETRPLDTGLLNGWLGLRDFFEVTFEDATGSTAFSILLTFCPNDPERQRYDDSGPDLPTYPPGCFANPFTKGVVWGIDHGWAGRIAASETPLIDIPNGRYTVHVSIADPYRELFGISDEDASIDITARVKRFEFSCSPVACGGSKPHVHAVAGPLGDRTTMAAAPTIDDPDPAILPDLIALPSWGIRVENRPRRSVLSFGATVWVAGASDLVVEGFRRDGEDVMDAYQYFYSGGEVIGRAPAGELEFDPKRGHEHWHFKQFAQYSLVDGNGGEVRASRKESFCLAATDAIDITLDGARLNPYVGLASACGSSNSIWTRETLPLGWGDTYFQNLPGQSFNITNVPNGTYLIRIEANPSGALYEQTAANNVELREVILKGAAGRRRVVVPPWNGIDSEL